MMARMLCVSCPRFLFFYLTRRWSVIINEKDDEPRVNSDIQSPEVLVIDDEGVKIGIIPTAEALRLAEERELDLVEVAPLGKPPVCRIMDYGKYRFKQQKRDKDARKKQKNQSVKEMKMRPKIDLHDYAFKIRAVKSFLEDGHRVKISVFFRGREMAFLDRGREVLNRVIADVQLLGKVEMEPRMEGSYMRIMIAPNIQTTGVPTKKQPEDQPDKPDKNLAKEVPEKAEQIA